MWKVRARNTSQQKMNRKGSPTTTSGVGGLGAGGKKQSPTPNDTILAISSGSSVSGTSSSSSTSVSIPASTSTSLNNSGEAGSKVIGFATLPAYAQIITPQQQDTTMDAQRQPSFHHAQSSSTDDQQPQQPTNATSKSSRTNSSSASGTTALHTGTTMDTNTLAAVVSELFDSETFDDDEETGNTFVHCKTSTATKEKSVHSSDTTVMSSFSSIWSSSGSIRLSRPNQSPLVLPLLPELSTASGLPELCIPTSPPGIDADDGEIVRLESSSLAKEAAFQRSRMSSKTLIDNMPARPTSMHRRSLGGGGIGLRAPVSAGIFLDQRDYGQNPEDFVNPTFDRQESMPEVIVDLDDLQASEGQKKHQQHLQQKQQQQQALPSASEASPRALTSASQIIDGRDNYSARIGKYALGKVLGYGSFSWVRQVKDVETGRFYAMKIIPRNTKKMRMANSDSVVLREAKVLKLLDHPGVVKSHAVMRGRDATYVVIDLLEGSLATLLAQHKDGLPELLARKYIIQVVEALDYCHSMGVFHRDIKLENIMYDKHGQVKIVDFGMAAMDREALHTEKALWSTHMGTPLHMAPELLDRRPGKHALTWDKPDVWALGIVIYVLVMGKYPWNGNDENELRRNVLSSSTQPLANLSKLSSDLVDLLCSILVRDSRMRPKMKTIKHHPWITKSDAQISFGLTSRQFDELRALPLRLSYMLTQSSTDSVLPSNTLLDADLQSRRPFKSARSHSEMVDSSKDGLYSSQHSVGAGEKDDFHDFAEHVVEEEAAATQIISPPLPAPQLTVHSSFSSILTAWLGLGGEHINQETSGRSPKIQSKSTSAKSLTRDEIHSQGLSSLDIHGLHTKDSCPVPNSTRSSSGLISPSRGSVRGAPSTSTAPLDRPSLVRGGKGSHVASASGTKLHRLAPSSAENSIHRSIRFSGTKTYAAGSAGSVGSAGAASSHSKSNRSKPSVYPKGFLGMEPRSKPVVDEPSMANPEVLATKRLKRSQVNKQRVFRSKSESNGESRARTSDGEMLITLTKKGHPKMKRSHSADNIISLADMLAVPQYWHHAAYVSDHEVVDRRFRGSSFSGNSSRDTIASGSGTGD